VCSRPTVRFLHVFLTYFKDENVRKFKKTETPFCISGRSCSHLCYITVYRHDIETSTNAIVNHTTNDLRQLSTLTTQTPDNRVSQYVACFIWQISLFHCFVMNYVWHEGSAVVIMILCHTVDINGYCREYIDTISICTSALKLQLHVCRWIIKTSQTVGEGKLGRLPLGHIERLRNSVQSVWYVVCTDQKWKGGVLVVLCSNMQ